MNGISLMASIFEWVINNAAYSLQAFLDGNYYMVAFFLNIFCALSDFIAETINSFSYVLHCYYLDFLAFINELYISISFILTSVINFLSYIFVNVYNVLCYISEIMYALYTNLILVIDIVQHYIFYTTENILYFSNLVFAAIVLILQLGPNLILYLYHVMCFSIVTIINYFQLIFLSAKSNCIIMCMQSKIFISNIPPKAYFGIILIALLYYEHHIIRKYLYHCVIFIKSSLLQLLSCIYLAIIYIINISNTCIYISTQSFLSVLSYLKRNNTTIDASRHRSHLLQRYLTKSYYLLNSLFCRKNKNNIDNVSSRLERILCVVCQEKEKNILLIPCRHLCMCEDCTVAVLESYLGCPLCRKQILDTVQVYT